MSFAIGIDTITQNMIASIVQSMQVPQTVIPEPTKPSLELYSESGRGRRGRPSHYLMGKKWCKGCEITFEGHNKCPECRRSARSVPHNKKYFRNQRKVFEGY